MAKKLSLVATAQTFESCQARGMRRTACLSEEDIRRLYPFFLNRKSFPRVEWMILLCYVACGEFGVRIGFDDQGVPTRLGPVMRRFSAGILMFRGRGGELEVFLVHPGGPFWQKKDIGAWSIPKGEYLNGEDELAAAKREFEEETGVRPEGEFIPLGSVTQPGGKMVTAWALEGDCSTKIRSNTFSMEWPPKSAQKREFPEVDRANWFPLPEARVRIHKGQTDFLERLVACFPHAEASKS